VLPGRAVGGGIELDLRGPGPASSPSCRSARCRTSSSRATASASTAAPASTRSRC